MERRHDGANKAIAAASFALHGDGRHHVLRSPGPTAVKQKPLFSLGDIFGATAIFRVRDASFRPRRGWSCGEMALDAGSTPWGQGAGRSADASPEALNRT